ncbi:hypothetical protein [Hydrocarboniphaga sp.]|uniref:hypothetical protein n=1 Tax=Hydrocarboniphaga sp. TaxID=2033016 RepID=UPI003D139EE4
MSTTPEPTSIIAGDSVSWTKSLSSYAPADGWALQYRLAPRNGGTAIAVGATAAGADFVVAVAANASAAWAPGEYTLTGAVIKGSQRAIVYQGELQLLPDPMAQTAADGRSMAERIVTAIDSWLVSKDSFAGETQLANIHGADRIRDVEPEQLIKLRSYYAAQALSDQAARRLAQGLGEGGTPGRVVVRM